MWIFFFCPAKNLKFVYYPIYKSSSHRTVYWEATPSTLIYNITSATQQVSKITWVCSWALYAVTWLYLFILTPVTTILLTDLFFSSANPSILYFKIASAFFPNFIYLFWGREGGRERERTPVRPCTASTEPDPELDLMNHEIMTWTEIKSQMLNWLSHPGVCLSYFWPLPLPNKF